MSLIKCKECGTDVSDKASACPNCGCPIDVIEKAIEEQKVANRKRYILIGGAVTIVCVLLFVIVHMIGRNCFTPYTKYLGEDESKLPHTVKRENLSDDLWIATQDVVDILGFDGHFTYYYNATDTENFTAGVIDLIGWGAELNDKSLSQDDLDIFLSDMQDAYGSDWDQTSYYDEYSGEMTCYAWEDEKGIKVVMKTNEDLSLLLVTWQKI